MADEPISRRHPWPPAPPVAPRITDEERRHVALAQAVKSFESDRRDATATNEILNRALLFAQYLREGGWTQ